MSNVSDWQAVARRLTFAVSPNRLPNLSRQHAILSLVKASTGHGVHSPKALLGPSVTGGGVNPNVYFKPYVPASWQGMKMKGFSKQLLVCSDHRIPSNTHFQSRMKHEDELPLIEGLLALTACSNVKRMYLWAEQLSDLAFPFGERVQRLQRS